MSLPSLGKSGAIFYQVRFQSGDLFWQLRVTDRNTALAVDRKGRGGLGLEGVKDRIVSLLDASEARHPATAGAYADIRALVAATKEEGIFERRIIDRQPLQRWSSRSLARRVVLLGDAAHAMHPASNRGACNAFIDAAELASALTSARDQGAFGDAQGVDGRVAARALGAQIAKYEDERLVKVNKEQETSRAAGIKQAADAASWMFRQVRGGRFNQGPILSRSLLLRDLSP